MALKTYDPKQVQVVIGPNIVSGFADGTFVKVTRDVDNFSLYIGADGEATRAKSNNKAGKLEITVQQSSAINDYLSGLAQLDEASNSGIVPFLVRDKSGRSMHAAEQSYIVKPADSEYSKETTTRTWVLQTNSLITFPAGN